MSEPHKGCFSNGPASHSAEVLLALSEKHLYCQKLECSPDTQGCVQLVIQSLFYQTPTFSNPKDR